MEPMDLDLAENDFDDSLESAVFVNNIEPDWTTFLDLSYCSTLEGVESQYESLDPALLLEYQSCMGKECDLGSHTVDKEARFDGSVSAVEINNTSEHEMQESLKQAKESYLHYGEVDEMHGRSSYQSVCHSTSPSYPTGENEQVQKPSTIVLRGGLFLSQQLQHTYDADQKTELAIIMSSVVPQEMSDNLLLHENPIYNPAHPEEVLPSRTTKNATLHQVQAKKTKIEWSLGNRSIVLQASTNAGRRRKRTLVEKRERFEQQRHGGACATCKSKKKKCLPGHPCPGCWNKIKPWNLLELACVPPNIESFNVFKLLDAIFHVPDWRFVMFFVDLRLDKCFHVICSGEMNNQVHQNTAEWAHETKYFFICPISSMLDPQSLFKLISTDPEVEKRDQLFTWTRVLDSERSAMVLNNLKYFRNKYGTHSPKYSKLMIGCLLLSLYLGVRFQQYVNGEDARHRKQIRFCSRYLQYEAKFWFELAGFEEWHKMEMTIEGFVTVMGLCYRRTKHRQLFAGSSEIFEEIDDQMNVPGLQDSLTKLDKLYKKVYSVLPEYRYRNRDPSLGLAAI